MIKGTVTRTTGTWCMVLAEEGQKYECRVKGRFKLDNKDLTNPVAVGDRVFFQREKEDKYIGTIVKIEPRTNYVVRQSPRNRTQLHLLAANIDQAVIIVTIKKPTLKPGFIDRFLLMTEPHDIPVIVVFHKADLYKEKELKTFEELKDIYTQIGYEVLLTSAINGQGIDDLKQKLYGKQSLVSGQSGVGKSTLINAMSPSLALKTQALSDKSGKGQHTTTFAEMHILAETTRIIDTPGIKSLSFNNLEVQDVAHNFREFFQWSSACKFSDCTHRDEPHCAVKKGLDDGQLSTRRYLHYLTILEEIENQNYWERPKNY